MTIDSNGMPGIAGSSGLMNMDKKTAKQLFGAGVVKTTLDYMNSDPNGSSGKNADYDFQTKVLEGGLMAKGMMVKGKV